MTGHQHCLQGFGKAVRNMMPSKQMKAWLIPHRFFCGASRYSSSFDHGLCLLTAQLPLNLAGESKLKWNHIANTQHDSLQLRTINPSTHHFPPLPITLKSHALPTTSQLASRLLPGPASPPLLLLATRYINFTNTRSDSIVVCLDRPWNPVEKSITDLFPGTAILVPHLEHRRILFCYPFNILPLLLRLQWCLTYLEIYGSFVIGQSLCRHLLAKTDIQCFRINR